MVCYHPIDAVLPLNEDSQGKRNLIFSPKKIGLLRVRSLSDCYNFSDTSELLWDYPLYINNNKVSHVNIKVPCGKCLGCRLDYSRRWAVRATHEASLYDYYKNNAFVTFTFNNYSLGQRTVPTSVSKLEFSQFIKRLRERVRREYGVTFRFMACGEYGATRQRPHYHCLFFGFNFPDKEIIHSIKDLTPRKASDGHMIFYYRSKFLEDCWKFANSDKSLGFTVISDVTFESCAYVSRYILKKNTGVYKKNQEKEFVISSRMPGLGYDYLLKNYNNMFELGKITLGNGVYSDIPRYYVDKLKDIDINMYNCYKLDKRNHIIDNLLVDNIDMTTERLLVREELKKVNLEKLVRRYEFSPDLHNI